MPASHFEHAAHRPDSSSRKVPAVQLLHSVCVVAEHERTTSPSGLQSLHGSQNSMVASAHQFAKQASHTVSPPSTLHGVKT
jgi:hypothetical protein